MSQINKTNVIRKSPWKEDGQRHRLGLLNEQTYFKKFGYRPADFGRRNPKTVTLSGR